jgi:4-diphosphocytidyl-2-C-methyl-D-erythritol kinase
MVRALTLHPPAKINWSLHVGPPQEDGYHAVRTVLQTIDLSDTLVFRPHHGPFALVTKATDVPADATNLVWRAAHALWTAAGRDGDPRDAHVTLVKRIPVGAGLGGGSADAAAALVGLNAIWRCRLTRHDLAHLGAALGADVPFFLTGGTGLGVGRGDEVYPLMDVKRLALVIIKPDFGVSTAQAYGWLDADRRDRGPASVGTELPVGWPAGPIAITNDLQLPVTARHPVIQEAIDACLEAGAMAAAMSGSGSAVFGVFSSSAAPRAARRLRRRDWRVVATRTLRRREAERRMAL